MTVSGGLPSMSECICSSMWQAQTNKNTLQNSDGQGRGIWSRDGKKRVLTGTRDEHRKCLVHQAESWTRQLMCWPTFPYGHKVVKWAVFMDWTSRRQERTWQWPALLLFHFFCSGSSYRNSLVSSAYPPVMTSSYQLLGWIYWRFIASLVATYGLLQMTVLRMKSIQVATLRHGYDAAKERLTGASIWEWMSRVTGV